MRVVALISGGKDSCYNMMKCVAAGHEIVALANLQPEQDLGDELDSFMFQTVGHEGVALIAETMEIPLFRRVTRGKSVTKDLVYMPTVGDEVEELYELLARVCEDCEGVEGVSSGAVLSDYQRLRVENVCSRLGLVSLSFLWRRDQEELLREMINNNLKAIIIKVASMGLDPHKHLGQSIEELYSDLCELNHYYGVNVCGEGGEYESFTLDCPLFKRRIVLLDSEIVLTSTDPYAPVGYLKLTKLALENKEPCPTTQTVPTKTCLVASPSLKLSLTGNCPSQSCQFGCYIWLALDSDPSEPTSTAQSEQLFKWAGTRLHEFGYEWCEAVLVYLYLADMRDYPNVNDVYRRHFSSKPPARVCVSMSLPEGTRVRMEVMVWRSEGVGRDGHNSMHVQSHSEWAPANIGPYSQAYSIPGLVFCAGQIGLEPSSMILATPHRQATLSLTHIQSILTSCETHLSRVLCVLCYYTNEEAGWSGRQTWSEASKHLAVSPHCPLLFLPVLSLPRGASVEWHCVAVKGPSKLTYTTTPIRDKTLGELTICTAIAEELKIGCWVLTAATEMSVPIDEAIESSLNSLTAHLIKYQLSLCEMSFVRICVPQFGLSTITIQGISRLCSKIAGGEIPLSVVTTQGYMGYNRKLIVQASKFHHS